MPIYLKAPERQPRGPDGRGWNRLSLHVFANDQCAWRPRSYPALVDAQDTRRARHGPYGWCIRDGQCDTCPIFNAEPRPLAAFTDRLLVRIHPHDGYLWIMNRPDDGWGEFGVRWTWEEVLQVRGWTVGDRYQDEHSDGFWLERSASPQS